MNNQQFLPDTTNSSLRVSSGLHADTGQQNQGAIDPRLHTLSGIYWNNDMDQSFSNTTEVPGSAHPMIPPPWVPDPSTLHELHHQPHHHFTPQCVYPAGVNVQSTSDTASGTPSPPPLSISPTPRKWKEFLEAPRNRDDLVRNAPKPPSTDFSALAQVIRVAQSPTGRQTDFTWGAHYDILYGSLKGALIGELNTRLRRGLQQSELLRHCNAVQPGLHPGMRSVILFTQQGMQLEIDWMLCMEHLYILKGLNLKKSEWSLEELDQAIKATGRWMYRPEE